MQERFSLLRQKNRVLSLDQYNKSQKKAKNQSSLKKKNKETKISDFKKRQDEQSDRLAFPKCVIPKCGVSQYSKEQSEIRVEVPIVTQSRAQMEKRYLELYEQYEDVYYENVELQNQKRSILLEIASIKKQEERLQQLLGMVKNKPRPPRLQPNSN